VARSPSIESGPALVGATVHVPGQSREVSLRNGGREQAAQDVVLRCGNAFSGQIGSQIQSQRASRLSPGPTAVSSRLGDAPALLVYACPTALFLLCSDAQKSTYSETIPWSLRSDVFWYTPHAKRHNSTPPLRKSLAIHKFPPRAGPPQHPLEVPLAAVPRTAPLAIGRARMPLPASRRSCRVGPDQGQSTKHRKRTIIPSAPHPSTIRESLTEAALRLLGRTRVLFSFQHTRCFTFCR
jgi:hypothetical protein